LGKINIADPAFPYWAEQLIRCTQREGVPSMRSQNMAYIVTVVRRGENATIALQYLIHAIDEAIAIRRARKIAGAQDGDVYVVTKERSDLIA
jgi:glucose/arabinose dehydrogenase